VKSGQGKCGTKQGGNERLVLGGAIGGGNRECRVICKEKKSLYLGIRLRKIFVKLSSMERPNILVPFENRKG